MSEAKELCLGFVSAELVRRADVTQDGEVIQWPSSWKKANVIARSHL